ncbi:Calcineurin-like phosphoesterase domain-containing protein [Bordetella sputigena]|uniref:metallophosphoesterase family protein n=1 Tax=Bordetella sputigena TaxID=1416810 RepID=UPI0039EFFE09
MKNSLIPQGARLFRFVVISDTHINQAEDRAAAFFKLNSLANGRARRAFADARRYAPDFVLHVGDIVHPMPSHPEFEQACANYRELEQAFDCPIYLTPGNHDIGDKPWPMAPVAQINPKYMEKYEKEFGRQWYEWSHEECHFFVINTSLLNAGLPEEQLQAAWFEQALRDAPGRKFLSLHYPPYVRDRNEASHYDNIDEPARSWLLDLIERHAIEAVFCGHVHNLWYNQLQNAEFYLLPSTAFVRQDYSELQRTTPPGPEGGRQDVEKLGYFVVDVFEHGHLARFVRLQNEHTTMAPALSASLADRSWLHIKRPALPNLAVDPCYPWAEDIAVPASGALDAFDHKIVRNDYPFFALCDMGIGTIRVPMSDLMRDSGHERFKELARIGLRAHVVLTEFPSALQRARLDGLGPALKAVELVVAPERLENAARAVADLARALPKADLLISKLRSPRDAAIDGLKYGHLIFHGWITAEADTAVAALAKHGPRPPNTALMFRVRMDESPLETADSLNALQARTGCRSAMLVRLSTDNPAEPQLDDAAATAQVLEAAIAAYRYPDLQVCIEGLVEFDRGFFLRRGLIDRSFNPRLAGTSLKHLCAVLSALAMPLTAARAVRKNGVHRIIMETAAGHWETLTGQHGSTIFEQSIEKAGSGDSTCWSLRDGEPMGTVNRGGNEGAAAFLISSQAVTSVPSP